MTHTIILEEETDGRFSVHCPELPGCHSWGETEEEAITNIKEAIVGYLEVVMERIERAKGHMKVLEITV
ncbi:type II toxin-antitoxin system HicB family antitoxin [bacterium]|nr:type II toxin-antitoxin system HicB family antitoxin [bacterium]